MEIKEKLKLSIKELPGNILKKETELLGLLEKIDEFTFVNRSIELKIQEEVTDETSNDGKKAFTNELKRRIESENRLSKNTSYVGNNDFIKENKKKVEELKITISYLKRLFKSTELLVLLGVD